MYINKLGLMLITSSPHGSYAVLSCNTSMFVGDLTASDQSLRERLITHTDEAELPSRWLSASVSA